MIYAILRHASGEMCDKYGVSWYLSKRCLACSKFTWYLGRRISIRFGILRSIFSLSSFLRAKLTVRGAISNLVLSSFGHIGPSQIRVFSIANVLLGILPAPMDTFSHPPVLFHLCMCCSVRISIYVKYVGWKSTGFAILTAKKRNKWFGFETSIQKHNRFQNVSQVLQQLSLLKGEISGIPTHVSGFRVVGVRVLVILVPN